MDRQGYSFVQINLVHIVDISCANFAVPALVVHVTTQKRGFVYIHPTTYMCRISKENVIQSLYLALRITP